MEALVSAPMALYQYFKPVSKSLPDPEGLLSKTLPSVTIKAANEVASKQPKVLTIKAANEVASKQPKVLRRGDA